MEITIQTRKKDKDKEKGKVEGMRQGERQEPEGKAERRGNAQGPPLKKKNHRHLGADSTRETPRNRANKGAIGAQEVPLGPLFERSNTRGQL